MATTIETNFIPLDLDVSNQSGSFELGDTPATNVANPITTNENPTSVNTNIIPSGGGSIVKGFLKTQNFNTGVSGWSIDGLGNVEFNDGNFRGDITGATGTFSGTVNVGSLNIPDTVTANSFHVNTDGDAWWGATAIGSAVAKIEKTGKGTFTDIIATGTINAQGGYLASGVYIGASNALLCEATGLNVGVTGHVRGGQTDYDTGTGFWLGYDTAAYKLSIGDSTDYLTWNGTNLDTSNLGINETFTAGEALVAGDFVFIGGDSKAYKIDGHTSELDDRFLGAATATISKDAVGEIRTTGKISGLSGLTAGTKYFTKVATASPAQTTANWAGSGYAVLQNGKGIGQSFKAAVTGSLTHVRTYLTVSGGGLADLKIIIYAADGSGFPTGAILATSSGYTPTTINGITDFWFENPVVLTANSDYCLEFSLTDPGPSLAAQGASTNLYANGACFRWYAGAWQVIGPPAYDMYFGIYQGLGDVDTTGSTKQIGIAYSTTELKLS